MAGALLNPGVLLGAWERPSRSSVSGARNVPRAQGPGPGRRRASWPRSPSPGRTFPGRPVRTVLGTGFPRRGSPRRFPGRGLCPRAWPPGGWAPGCTLVLGDLPPTPAGAGCVALGSPSSLEQRIFRNCGKERFLPAGGGAGPAQGTSWRPPAGPARGPLPRGWHAWQPSPQPWPSPWGPAGGMEPAWSWGLCPVSPPP